MTILPASMSPRRINVRGATGSGKTQLATELATRLALPHIELDGLYWGSGWSEPAPDAFRATVRETMDANPQGWVIDGSYDSKLGDLVTSAADTIIWLDLPLNVILTRLLRRTIRRVAAREELWNGNRETWREQFASRESLFLWTLHAHRRHRRTWTRRFENDPRLVRLRTRADVNRWLSAQPDVPRATGKRGPMET